MAPMIHRNWITTISAATTASDVSFCKATGVGAGSAITVTRSEAWSPMDWMAFFYKGSAAVDIRVYMPGIPGWLDPGTAFADDYAQQYLQFQPITSGGPAIVMRGIVYGFAVVQAPTGGLTIHAGTGPCPYAG